MKYALLFRTHYWSDYLQERLNDLKKMAPSADIYVAYDATNSNPPDIDGVAAHSLNSLSALGLYIPKDRALWYCGDYPFYDFYNSYPQYDYYLMIENDVYISGLNIDAAIKKVDDEQIDILGSHFISVDDAPPGTPFSKGRSMYKSLRKCFFPVVGLKRSTLVSLFGERLRQAEVKQRDANFELPFCETYIGSHTLKLDAKHLELNEVLPTRIYGASKYMLYDKVAAERKKGVWHSVLPVERYLDAKIRQEFHRSGKKSFTENSIIEDLKDAIKFSNYSILDIKDKLHVHSETKLGRDIYKKRIDDLIIPLLQSN